MPPYVLPIVSVLTLLLGLTFLAYRHPHIYKRLHTWFLGASVVVILAITIHNEGWTDAYQTFSPHIQADKLETMRDLVWSKQVPYQWTLLGFFTFAGYLFVLLYLRKLLRRERRDFHAASADSGPSRINRPTPKPHMDSDDDTDADEQIDVRVTDEPRSSSETTGTIAPMPEDKDDTPKKKRRRP